MLIKDVCKECNLTKKAVEYYEKQGLVSPKILENGYRDFSKEDIDKLQIISILRKLELSIDNIKNYLISYNKNILYIILQEKELEQDIAKQKQDLLKELTNGASWSNINTKLETIDTKQTITRRLLEIFPGYFGKFISYHFAQFLNEPIITKEQKAAYEKIVDFLDSIEKLTLPLDLQQYYEKADTLLNSKTINNMSENMINAVDNPDEFLNNNKEFLKQYLAYKNSEEYKNSPVYKIRFLPCFFVFISMNTTIYNLLNLNIIKE